MVGSDAQLQVGTHPATRGSAITNLSSRCMMQWSDDANTWYMRSIIHLQLFLEVLIRQSEHANAESSKTVLQSQENAQTTKQKLIANAVVLILCAGWCCFTSARCMQWSSERFELSGMERTRHQRRRYQAIAA